MSGPCGFGSVYECPSCSKPYYKESWHYFVAGAFSDGCASRGWVPRHSTMCLFKCACGKTHSLYGCRQTHESARPGGPLGFQDGSGQSFPKPDDLPIMPPEETLDAIKEIISEVPDAQRMGILLFAVWDCNDALNRRNHEIAWPKDDNHDWLISSLLSCLTDSPNDLCLKTELFRYLGRTEEAKAIVDGNKEAHMYFDFQRWMIDHNKIGVYPVMKIDEIEKYMETLEKDPESGSK